MGILDFTRLYSEYDYPEDADLENGNYENKCFKCNKSFIGHKRRTYCRVCKKDFDKRNQEREFAYGPKL